MTARGQAHELQQLLDISTELGHVGKLDEFMNAFALRARDFLGFGRACIGLLEEGKFRLRWKTIEGQSSNGEGQGGEADSLMPEGVATRALLSKQPFLDPMIPPKSPAPGWTCCRNLTFASCCLCRCWAATAKFWGCSACWAGSIGRLSHRRTFVAPSRWPPRSRWRWKATHNLHLSEQHRRRADSLMRLALELNTLLRLPDFAKGFTARAMEMTGASGAALLVKQGAGLEVVALQSPAEEAGKGPWLARYSGPAVAEALALRPQPVISSTAEELFWTRSLPWSAGAIALGAPAVGFRGTGWCSVPC